MANLVILLFSTLAVLAGLLFVGVGLVTGYATARLGGRWILQRHLDPTPAVSVEPGDGLVKVRGRAAPPGERADRWDADPAEAPFTGRPAVFGTWSVARLDPGRRRTWRTVGAGRFGGDFDVVGDTGRVRVAVDLGRDRPVLELHDDGSREAVVDADDDPPEWVRRVGERTDADPPERLLELGPADVSQVERRFRETVVAPGDAVEIVGRATETPGSGSEARAALGAERFYDVYHVTDDPEGGQDTAGLVLLFGLALVFVFGGFAALSSPLRISGLTGWRLTEWLALAAFLMLWAGGIAFTVIRWLE